MFHHKFPLVFAFLLAFMPVIRAEDDAAKTDKPKDTPTASDSATVKQDAAPSEKTDAVKTDTEKRAASRLPDINVTAARSDRKTIDLPYSTNWLDFDSPDADRFRTLPEAMAALPGVVAQKTGHGQGSPYIRGFTGFQTLLLVDGIRLNNSVFRSGPNQYWGTVDSFSLDRLELVQGPSSVQYGSDAVGGTVNAITIEPDLDRSGFYARPTLRYRYASAEQAHIGRLEFEVTEHGKAGFVAGFTSKRFGDLIGGNHVGVMKKTGYVETDADVKGVWRIAENLSLTVGAQHLFMDDAWRTHKTVYGIAWHGTTVGNEKQRSLDQQRDLGYARLEWKQNKGLLRRVAASLSYHYQQEDRERVRSDDRRDTQGFDAGTVGLWVAAEIASPVGHITVGAENYHDVVNSFARKYSTDGSLNAIPIQGPVGDDATYNLFGAYVQDELKLADLVEITGGLRFTWAAATADQVQDPETGDQISLDDAWTNLSASLRVLLVPAKGARVFAGVSQGFRAPNLSDLTRLDEARSDEIETPSLDLDPETFVTFDLGVRLRSGPVRAQACVFYTLIQNGIMRYPTGVMIGSDHEVTKANVGDGYVYGIELSGTLDLGFGFEAGGTFSFSEGMQDTYTATRELVTDWMSRVAPVQGRIDVKWRDDKDQVWARVEVVMVGKADKLSLRDQGDTQRIPPGGTPGYALLNLHAGTMASDGVRFFASLENAFNKDYQVHGSGLNGPGTNFVLGVELGLP